MTQETRRPMLGPPEWYGIDWNPLWGMVRAHYPNKWDRTFSHAELDKKRLTDAECAAEYWRAASDFRDRLRHGRAGDDLNPEWGRRLIWHRFATAPHALEEA